MSLCQSITPDDMVAFDSFLSVGLDTFYYLPSRKLRLDFINHAPRHAGYFYAIHSLLFNKP